MNTAKILVDARVIGGEAQGSATYVKGLYSSLYNNFGSNYDFYFAGYDFGAMKAAFPFLKKDRFIQLHSTSKFKLFGYEFPKIIKAHQIDFAHFQYVTPFFKNCKFIVTTHDVLFNDFPEDFSKWYTFQRNLLFKPSLEKSEIRLTVSDYSRKRIAAHYNLPESTLHITPNAVRKEFFQPFDIEETKQQIEQEFGAKNYLLYVSRIEPRKNHQMVMDAYRALKLNEQNIELVFIGNDTLESTEVIAEIDKMKADFPNHFNWFSGISDEALLNFYRGAEMFIYPSRAEGFGIPPIEAAAAGVNTLCSNETAMKDFDFFEDNCFSPDNLEELTQKIQQNLNAPRRAWELYDIQGRVNQKYSWDNSAHILHNLIQREAGKEIIKLPVTKPKVALEAVA